MDTGKETQPQRGEMSLAGETQPSWPGILHLKDAWLNALASRSLKQSAPHSCAPAKWKEHVQIRTAGLWEGG